MPSKAQRGSQALPIARAFLAVGGRIMLNPNGKIVTGGEPALLLPRQRLPGRAAQLHHRPALRPQAQRSPVRPIGLHNGGD